MPIKILNPKLPAGKGVAVPAHFIASGTKKDQTEIPLGALVSVTPAGVVKYLIGGRLVEYKDSTGAVDPKQWAMFFATPTEVLTTQQFTLAVVDGAGLPGSISATSAEKAGPLVIRKRNKKNERRAHGGGINPLLVYVTFPASGGAMDKSQPYACGYLPEGETNIDSSGTILEDAGDPSINSGVDWIYLDESGFWAVFFRPTVAGVKNVCITYYPNGSVEELTGVVAA